MTASMNLDPKRAITPPDPPAEALMVTDKDGAWRLGWAGGWLAACGENSTSFVTSPTLTTLTPLTTAENEILCLIHAAEAYSASRKTVNKPTSRIDGLIERLKMSPQGYDLVWVPRPKKDETK